MKCPRSLETVLWFPSSVSNVLAFVRKLDKVGPFSGGEISSIRKRLGLKTLTSGQYNPELNNCGIYRKEYQLSEFRRDNMHQLEADEEQTNNLNKVAFTPNGICVSGASSFKCEVNVQTRPEILWRELIVGQSVSV